jgi:hypothetical protein
MKARAKIWCAVMLFLAAIPSLLFAQQNPRSVAGLVLNPKDEAIVGALITATAGERSFKTITDAQGHFALELPAGSAVLIVSGKFLQTATYPVSAVQETTALVIKVREIIPQLRQSMVITATGLEPSIDRRNDTIYKNTLSLRDDQLLETLGSGINAGQHEGGGKSLEVRRFGFNLDHGGVNGGLKVLVDDVPQNQATQAHGQGYLGWLKSLSPELVDDVDIINGPFSAEYGDFSALGVVHVRLKERLENLWTLRAQGGSFGSYRTFAAWSPKLQKADSFLSWEHAYTDGPFQNPLRYVRDNVSGNYTFKLDPAQSLGFKFNGGRNNFDSSGQIPLDLVASGQLGRFGYMDPSDGGKVRTGTASTYYKKDLSPNDTLRVDGFVTRSLFDLYSDFTFYLNDPVHGDGLQQHDSRLQEGSSAQYVHAAKLWGRPALFVAGANLFDSWINVGLFHDQNRQIIAPVPGNPATESDVHITNAAVYAQQGIDFPHLLIDVGLRYDGYRFNLANRLVAANSGLNYAGNAEPKVNIVYTPTARIPLAIHLNYGRAITSQDARGMALDPAAPKVAATNFYMVGTSHHLKCFSLSTDMFLINRQHEDVYDPDNGTMQYQGPSRSYGWEAKTSVQLNKHLSWNAGITQVSNAFFLGTSPRQYVDSAPHTVANSSLTLANWKGLFSSLRYRHIGHYLLTNPDDTSVPPSLPLLSSAYALASGLDVIDFAVTKKLSHGLEWNLAIDNLNNKHYYETQNLFDSRVTPSAPVEARVHGTPGYPFSLTTGFTWRFE